MWPWRSFSARRCCWIRPVFWLEQTRGRRYQLWKKRKRLHPLHCRVSASCLSSVMKKLPQMLCWSRSGQGGSEAGPVGEFYRSSWSLFLILFISLFSDRNVKCGSIFCGGGGESITGKRADYKRFGIECKLAVDEDKSRNIDMVPNGARCGPNKVRLSRNAGRILSLWGFFQT